MTASGLERARERRALMLQEGIPIAHLNPIEKAAKNPQSKALAIKAKCFDCVGQDADPDWRGRVRECDAEGICPLWPVRSYR